MMRNVALFSALAFIALLTFLTVSVLVREGFDILVGFSLVILALFLFGIVGALLNPPKE
jgi:hypothetical protein